MSAAHTPGPWMVSPRSPTIVIRDYTPISDEGELIASAYGYGSDQALHNARLIAAAPELLEACRSVLRVHEEWTAEINGQTNGESECIGHCRAAIAKATGSAA